MSACVACEGTGKASKGGPCVPCRGTGINGADAEWATPPMSEAELAAFEPTVAAILLQEPFPGVGLARLSDGSAAIIGPDGACTLTLAQWERVLGAALADKQWRKAIDRGVTETYRRIALGNAKEALKAALRELDDE